MLDVEQLLDGLDPVTDGQQPLVIGVEFDALKELCDCDCDSFAWM